MPQKLLPSVTLPQRTADMEARAQERDRELKRQSPVRALIDKYLSNAEDFVGGFLTGRHGLTDKESTIPGSLGDAVGMAGDAPLKAAAAIPFRLGGKYADLVKLLGGMGKASEGLETAVALNPDRFLHVAGTDLRPGRSLARASAVSNEEIARRGIMLDRPNAPTRDVVFIDRSFPVGHPNRFATVPGKTIIEANPELATMGEPMQVMVFGHEARHVPLTTGEAGLERARRLDTAYQAAPTDEARNAAYFNDPNERYARQGGFVDVLRAFFPGATTKQAGKRAIALADDPEAFDYIFQGRGPERSARVMELIDRALRR